MLLSLTTGDTNLDPDYFQWMLLSSIHLTLSLTLRLKPYSNHISYNRTEHPNPDLSPDPKPRPAQIITTS